MRVPDNVGRGSARVTLSLDAWADGHVLPATVDVPVLPRRVEAYAEAAANLDSPKKVAPTTLKGSRGIALALAYSPDDKLLAAGGVDGPVLLWRKAGAATGSPLELAAAGKTVGVAFSPDGQALASVHAREERRTAATGKETVTLSGEARLWDTATGRLLATLNLPDRYPDRVTFLPGGHGLLLAVGRWRGSSLAWRLERWDLKAAEAVPVAELADRVGAVAPDGAVLATTGESVRLCDAATARPLAALPTADRSWPCYQLAFSPDGRTLAGGNYAGRVQIWDLQARKLRAVLNHGAGNRRVGALAFAPDGKTLAVALMTQTSRPGLKAEDLAAPLIALWDLAALRTRAVVQAPPGIVVSLAFDPNGRTLAAGVRDAVLLWDVASLLGDR